MNEDGPGELHGHGVVRDHPSLRAQLIPSPRSFVIVALALVATVVGLSTVTFAVTQALELPVNRDYARIFWIGEESNLPTFVNFSLFCVCAAFAAANARIASLTRSRWRWHWLAVPVVSLLLAFDEAAQLHERLNGPVRDLLQTSGALYYAWVLPGMAFIVMAALLFIGFLMDQTVRARRLMVAGATCYASGAIGVEMLGASIADAGAGRDSVAYLLSVTFEEGLEMIGLTLLATGFLVAYRSTLAAADAIPQRGGAL